MFPMTITIHTVEQLHAVLGVVGKCTPVTRPEAIAAPEAPEKTEKAPAAKKSKPEPVAEAVATPEPKAEPAPVADDAQQATYQDAAAAITKLSRVKGRDTAVALLGEFGASKLPDVKPEQFADIIGKANALMGE